MPAPKGHIKWGGKKKGSKHKKTIKQEEALKFIQDKIRRELDPILDALIAKCKDKDTSAIKESLDRLIGRSKENLDVTSGGEKIYTWAEYVKKQENEPKMKP